MTYLMESPDESKRLLMKSDESTSREQLLLTGLTPGMTAVDAGGGAGFVTKIISEIVGAKGKAILVDQSAERLAAAKDYNQGRSNVFYTQSSLEKIDLASDSVDYVFCRFVFEYLEKPDLVFKELLRILKPRGKLVVGDLDHNILSHYPLPAHLEAQLFEATSLLSNKGLWDAYAGRKLYSQFYRNGLQKIQVHMIAHHLIYGEAADRDVQNWEFKLERLEQMQKAKTLDLSFEVPKFRKEFMGFFKNPERFSYSPLILVEGVKA